MEVPYIISNNSITVYLNGKDLTMSVDHVNFDNVKEAIRDKRWDELEDLFDQTVAVEKYLDGNITVEGNTVHYGLEEVHGHVVDRILEFMRDGLPHEPLVKFLDKLMLNPSRRSVEELYRFLEHKNMPLTPNGNFLAYKGVTSDFKDHYSGKFDNSVGQTLSMRRNQVCDDADIGCSYGFHAGSYEYAKGYSSGGGHLLRVEIDPSDVVSVPKDCDCQKLRTAKYKVVALHETIETPLDEGIYGDYDEEYDDPYRDDDEIARENAYSDEENEAYAEGYNQAKQDLGYGDDD